MAIHRLNIVARLHAAHFLSLVHYHFLAGLGLLYYLIVQWNKYLVPIISPGAANILILPTSQMSDGPGTSSRRLIAHN